MDKRTISKFFLIVLLAATALLVRLFRTYISAIVLALLIASAFFPLYGRLRMLLKDQAQPAALVMCVFIAVVLIIPVGGSSGPCRTRPWTSTSAAGPWSPSTASTRRSTATASGRSAFERAPPRSA